MINYRIEFTGVSVIIPATNETNSLIRIISTLRSDEFAFVDAVIVAAATDECPAATATRQINKEYGYNVGLYIQKSSSLPGLIPEIGELIQSSHFVIVFADGEHDIYQIKDMVSYAIRKPAQIICASKWLKGAHVYNYGILHEFCTRTINAILRAIIHTDATDIISIFQLCPTEIYKSLNVFSYDDALFRFTMLPLASGMPYTEIPANFKARKEGKSNFNVTHLINAACKFIQTAINIRRQFRAL